MLLNLHVKNLAIIDEVEVYFNDHLNILTGETGAGKSIIIGSINIALGGKVSKEMIRKGADYALVELVFQIEDVHTLSKIRELDIELEDNQIIISRKIMNGRVVNKINGENVPTNTLKQISSLLIDIHGQHEHQSLLYKTKHLSIVDRYARKEITDLKKELNEYYKKYSEVRKELENTFESEEQRLRQISFLEYEINEIESARLKKGEEEELFQKFKKMSNMNQISDALGTVYQLTSDGEQSVADLIGRAVKSISRVTELDEEMEQFANQLSDIESLINDFNRDLSDYRSDLNFDPSIYNEIDERLSLIHTLKSKYGTTIEDIEAYYEEAVEKLTKYRDYDLYLKKIQGKKEALEEKLDKLCKELSEIRKQNAAKLKEGILTALVDLNFLNVDFDISFKQLDRYTEQGFDDVEFLISTNTGEDLKPLAKVASGGELSRVMLAIKSVLADNDAIDTLIFDEIDVGISGRTAQKVSQRLALIAKEHQVLCITHLPQITAMADSHYIIEKSDQDERTTTTIYQLDEKKSIEELARILGGYQITDAVLASAKEMKQLASHTKLY